MSRPSGRPASAKEAGLLETTRDRHLTRERTAVHRRRRDER